MKAKQMWRIWISIVFIILFLRITILSDSNEDLRYTIFNIYALPTWLTLMIVGFIRGRQSRSYLRNNHPEIYNKFCSRAYGTDVIVDPIALLKFGYSKRKYDDVELNSMRNEMRSFSNLVLTVFFTLPVLFLIMMI